MLKIYLPSKDSLSLSVSVSVTLGECQNDIFQSWPSLTHKSQSHSNNICVCRSCPETLWRCPWTRLCILTLLTLNWLYAVWMTSGWSWRLLEYEVMSLLSQICQKLNSFLPFRKSFNPTKEIEAQSKDKKCFLSTDEQLSQNQTIQPGKLLNINKWMLFCGFMYFFYPNKSVQLKIYSQSRLKIMRLLTSR